MSRLLAVMVWAGITTSCWAHWTEQPELPDWAQRGRLYWCLHYATATRELVDLFADGGQTFIHGGVFKDEPTGQYAFERGLRYMPYVCSRTLTTMEMERNPQLKSAVLLKADGSEFLAYNNPVRRYGSMATEAWPAYVRERVQRVRQYPNVWAVFFDNAMVPVDDHRPENIAAWQAWARERGIDPGQDVPDIYNSPQAAYSRAFSRDMLIRYYGDLQQYCHAQDPPLLSCPNSGNAYGLAALEAGVLDLVFFENARHPPFYRNFFLYKSALAAGHGRPAAILAYIPEAVGQQRGVRTWHEGMHHFFYPSSPHAEEFALAIAEAAAVCGNYVTCYNLFPALPITDTTDPFNRRIYREIKRMNSFLHANEELYARAQPGAEIGLLYSADTELQNRHLGNYEELSAALTRAGIPWEVVVPSDLRTDGALEGISALVLPNVLYLDAEAAAGALQFVHAGGRAIITGEFALYDRDARPGRPEAAEELVAPLHLTSLPIRQWQLDGFEPEGTSHVKATRVGATATLSFDGTPGEYVAYISMTDENDGTSTFELAVAGKQVFTGLLDQEDNQTRWHASPPFALRPGDLVVFTVRPDAGELCRTQGIVLARSDAGTGAPLGRGRVLYQPQGLEKLSASELLRLLGSEVWVPQPGEVAVNRMDVPDLGISTVHLVNYGLRYEVTVPGLYASDDGTAEARTFFSGDRRVLRKRIAIPDPDKLSQPVLQISAFSVGNSDGGLIFTINGKQAGRLAHNDLRQHQWYELPLDRSLLAAENIIEVRAEGTLTGTDTWIQVDIDTDATTGNSWCSEDGGQTFTSEDLSPDRKAQTGEFLIRIKDRSPGIFAADPDNLVRNPGFEQVQVPHAETTITLVPARELIVQTRDRQPRPCLAISPDGPPQWIEGRAGNAGTAYPLPPVEYYTVLLLADDRARLEPFAQANAAGAFWTLPQVTEPLRAQLVEWEPFGEGFALDETGGRNGGRAIVIENNSAADIRGASQQFLFEGENQPRKLTITAWSRAQNASGPDDAHYSVWVDATCSDGTVFNGHQARFSSGSHDWEQATLVLEPPAPIRTMRLYLLFRYHTGKVWFDDVRMVAQ